VKKPLHLQDLKAALEAKPLRADKSEAAYKRDLVAQINAIEGGYARRIEDRFAVGVLDLFIKYPGHDVVMAEGKIIEGNLFAPTERQFEEGMRLGFAGIEPVLIGWKDGQMYVSEWAKQADYRECFTLERAPYVEILWRYLRL
jgi:hypothetical protein